MSYTELIYTVNNGVEFLLDGTHHLNHKIKTKKPQKKGCFHSHVNKTYKITSS